jgi:predicted HicB family RNase H-like nuclease
MTVAVESESMAKKRGRPKTSERDDATARIDRGVLAKAQMVAKARKISLAEYLTDLLHGPVDRDFLREMKKLEGGKP